MNIETIYHIVAKTEWAEAVVHGIYRPASLENEGFVHFSTREQVLATATRFYAGRTDLLLLAVNPVQLTGTLVFEDLYDHGAQFPHLYAPLLVGEVAAVHHLPYHADGTHRWPAGLP